MNGGIHMEEKHAGGCPGCADSSAPAPHYRHTVRDESALRQLHNRLNRIIGQLNGIGRMLDENRWCGDILIQIAAAEKALQSFGYTILSDHMNTCVAEEIRNGNTAVMDETIELMKNLK